MRRTAYARWTVLVAMNACYSAWAAVMFFKSLPDLAGMLAGIATFVVAYAKLDIHLANQGAQLRRQQLIVAAIFKSLTQLVPVLEMHGGILAAKIVAGTIGPIPFLTTYLMTIFDGLWLSMFLFLLLALVRAFSLLPFMPKR